MHSEFHKSTLAFACFVLVSGMVFVLVMHFSFVPFTNIDDGKVAGLMTVNVEQSLYKGQDCLFVNISTGFDRNGGPNPSQNLCQVRGEYSTFTQIP